MFIQKQTFKLQQNAFFTHSYLKKKQYIINISNITPHQLEMLEFIHQARCPEAILVKTMVVGYFKNGLHPFDWYVLYLNESGEICRLDDTVLWSRPENDSDRVFVTK